VAAARLLDRVAAVLLCVALPLVIFAPTLREMVDIWRRSDVFTHCFLVFPVFAYLVWSARADLHACPVRPTPFGLLAVAASVLLWALGFLSAALTPAFFGLISLSIATVVTVLGWRIARAIWVPLLFLYFAVPFGEVFVPKLVEWTADFTVAAIAASGVPVFREGANFVVPTGRWSVVDAGSGDRSKEGRAVGVAAAIPETHRSRHVGGARVR
jgi:exosortase